MTRVPLLCPLVLLIAHGCKPTVAPVGVETPPKGPIEALVPAWQPFDPSWIEKSTVVFRAEVHGYNYPCEFDEEGNSRMILARGFTVLEVLKGNVQAPEVNISQVFDPSAPVPPHFIDGREYLVLMTPDDTTASLLANPDTVWGIYNEPHASEVVSIIDLSQSKEEAEALSIPASRSGTHEGYTFTPEGWDALRSSEANDLDAQLEALSFIRHKVLVEGASLAEVRSWLGEPDFWFASTGGFHYRYHLHAASHHSPRKDMVSIRLEVDFKADLEIARWAVENLICIEVDESGDSWTYLTEEQLDELGLENIVTTFE